MARQEDGNPVDADSELDDQEKCANDDNDCDEKRKRLETIVTSSSQGGVRSRADPNRAASSC